MTCFWPKPWTIVVCFVDILFLYRLSVVSESFKITVVIIVSPSPPLFQMIPIESFETLSLTGSFVPVVPGGSNIKLTFHNRKEYVEKSILFRLHELDIQVAAVREGMAAIIPVPLLSLYTARMLEAAVCGLEEVDLQMLRKVVRWVLLSLAELGTSL